MHCPPIYYGIVAHRRRRFPGPTNRLVTEVLKANPRTVVVNQSGTPVEMPWVAEAHTLVQVIANSTEATSHLSLTWVH